MDENNFKVDLRCFRYWLLLWPQHSLGGDAGFLKYCYAGQGQNKVGLYNLIIWILYSLKHLWVVPLFLLNFYVSFFARKGNQIVLDVALYPGDTIRILILYGNEDLELQTAKEPHLDWTNWKVLKNFGSCYQLCFELIKKKF